MALCFDIVEVLGQSLSVQKKITKFVNLHELLPPKLHLFETHILLAFFIQVFLHRGAGKDGKNGLTCLVYAFNCP